LPQKFDQTDTIKAPQLRQMLQTERKMCESNAELPQSNVTEEKLLELSQQPSNLKEV